MLVIIVAASFAILLRAIISLHSYSGYGKPPMYGDYEAQRHWQEITFNLPISEWYENTTSNDLMYWGLDYPPLTAYHSWALGHFANWINPKYVSLNDSRGITDDQHKFFMRHSVLTIDLLLYIPSMIWMCFIISKLSRKKETQTQEKTDSLGLHLMLALLFPGQILIDNGHFQYNNVSLGFTTLAVIFLLRDRYLIGAITFVLALNYKQMELYHALPFFFYLLAKCFVGNGKRYKFNSGIKNLRNLSIVVIITFIIIWMPWLRSLDSTLQVVHRIFPVARGVFEDKVSNVWCVVNVFIKIKQYYNINQMAIICLAFTMVSVIPSSVQLLLNPNKTKFLFALVNSSLAFFLFSFQVHEKSILLAALPVIFIIPSEPIISIWFLYISTFSMLPLFQKDGLILAYIGLSSLYLLLIRIQMLHRTPGTRRSSSSILLFRDFLYLNELHSPYTLFAITSKKSKYRILTFLYSIDLQKVVISILYQSILASILILIGMLYIPAPVGLPDFYPLLISAFSCAHFVAFFIFFNIKQLVSN